MQKKHIYTIGSSKLDMAYSEGFIRTGDNMPSAATNGNSAHFIILNRFCSYEGGTKWGRFHCIAELSPSSTLKIRAFASDGDADMADELNNYFHNPSISWAEKKAYFESNGVQFINCEDVLLYELEGEYLWISLEIEGNGHNKISDMMLDSQGDNFMQTFPEIYQDEGSFFHRYMSIFSSIYQDMSNEVNNMDKYLDIETAPIPVLKEIAGWMGFEAEGDFLDNRILRRLIKEIYRLNRIKGTKAVLKEIIGIILGENAVVIERNCLEGHVPDGSTETYNKLYGDTMQDVTILVKHGEDERLQEQLMYLFKKFKPVRSSIRLVFSQRCGSLDSYCYLDYNASLARRSGAKIDSRQKMNGTVVLR